MAPGRPGRTGCHRGPPLARPLRGERRQRLVQGRVHRPGRAWPEHDERCRRSEEFIRALRSIWAEDHVGLAGDVHRLRDFSPEPGPLGTPGRPHPEIFPGGNSAAARAMAGRVSDWYFSNGRDLDGVAEQLTDVHRSATRAGRKAPRFGLNGFLIARDTEAEARAPLREIVAGAGTEAAEGFDAAVTQAGKSTADGKGMWQDSTFEDLVPYNDGFRTGPIGTPEQIAERIVAYKRLGVDLFLPGFLHYHEEVEYFGRRVLPLVRELEAAGEADPAPPAVPAHA